MKSYIVRFWGLVLMLIVLAVGVVIGRVIEAMAVAVVVYAVWTYARRLVVAPDQRTATRERRLPGMR